MQSIFEHINKRVVVGGAVALAIILAFLFYLMGNRTPQSAVTRIETSPLEGALGKELLATLSRLKSTTLDTSIFTDPVFESLKDFGVEIASQPVGRRNPFAPFEPTAPASGGAAAKIPAGSGKTVAPPSPPAQEEEFLEFQFE